MMLNQKIPGSVIDKRMKTGNQGYGLDISSNYVMSPSILNIEKMGLKISGKPIQSYVSINQNSESGLNENDDWKYQLPTLQTLSRTIKRWVSSKLSFIFMGRS